MSLQLVTCNIHVDTYSAYMAVTKVHPQLSPDGLLNEAGLIAQFVKVTRQETCRRGAISITHALPSAAASLTGRMLYPREGGSGSKSGSRGLPAPEGSTKGKHALAPWLL